MFRKSIAWTVAVVLLAGLAVAQEKVTLKSKFPPGTFTCTVTQDMGANIEMGPEQKMEQKQVMLIVTEVTIGPVEADAQKGSMEFTGLVPRPSHANASKASR